MRIIDTIPEAAFSIADYTPAQQSLHNQAWKEIQVVIKQHGLKNKLKALKVQHLNSQAREAMLQALSDEGMTASGLVKIARKAAGLET